MKYEAIILDTETTGVDEPDVIELAWVGYGVEAGGHYRFKPGKEISLGALATHHILAEDLNGCLPSTRAAGMVPIADFWIGHNVDFDWKALGRPTGPRRICTLAMCRAIWPKCDSHSLTAMTYFLEGRTTTVREKVRQAHGAPVDVALCAGILGRIVEGEGIETLSDLYLFSEECRIPKVMSFGKYKGQLVSAVGKGWANWYARQDDTDLYLLTALRKAGKL